MSAIGRWRALGQSVRGASHVRATMPNQDAWRCLPASAEGSRLIVAVSDGHGSARSFRSHIGSARAVDIAAWVLQDLLDGQPDPLNLSAIKRTAEERLPHEIVRRWEEAVAQDRSEHPFTEEELAVVVQKHSPKAVEEIEANPRLAYGATLLVVLVTPAFILYLQLGDGDILTISETGEVTRPMPEDTRLFANQTTSLCIPDAWRDFRIRFQVLTGEPPALILLSTDGYANSFVNEEAFLKVGTDIWDILRTEGLGTVEANLEGWLNQASTSGSGDDITLALLCRVNLLPTPEELAARELAATQAALPSTKPEGAVEEALPTPAAETPLGTQKLWYDDPDARNSDIDPSGDTMNNLARQKLSDLVQHRQAIKSKKGHDPISHERTFRRQMEKRCGGECLAEINVLASAVREQIPVIIEREGSSTSISNLSARLVENHAMHAETARWAVMAWAEALGVSLEEPAPTPAAEPEPEPAAEPEPAVLFSTWKMSILSRVYDTSGEGWGAERDMPPARLFMPDEEIGVRPLGLNYTQIELWARNFRMPERICYLDLSDRSLFDSSLECLTVFTHLRELNLAKTSVIGGGLAFLKDLPLTWLNLAGCRNLSDKGLQSIASLVHLETLDLSYCTGIAGRGLAHEKPLEHLRVLNLERCSTLQEEVLASLAAMPALEDLDLSDTQVDGMGLMHFRNNTTLRKLSLEGCARFKSQTVPHLLNLEALEVLHLGRTSIGDADLEQLKALQNLRELHLYGCAQVTADKVAELRTRGLRVFHDSDPVILG